MRACVCMCVHQMLNPSCFIFYVNVTKKAIMWWGIFRKRNTHPKIITWLVFWCVRVCVCVRVYTPAPRRMWILFLCLFDCFLFIWKQNTHSHLLTHTHTPSQNKQAGIFVQWKFLLFTFFLVFFFGRFVCSCARCRCFHNTNGKVMASS